MFLHRITQYSPLWVRGFFLHKMVMHLWAFSPFMLGTVLLLLYRPRREIVRLIIAIYLTVTAIGLGGDWQGHHFVVAVPLYVALFMEHRKPLMQKTLIILVSLAILTLPIHPTQTDNTKDLKIAHAVDDILSSCEVDRYYFVEYSNKWYAYTEHTPLNYYPFTIIEHLLRYHIIVKERSLESIKQAKIVILDGEYKPQTDIPMEYGFGLAFKKIIDNEFTTTPWSCAMGKVVPDRIVLYKTI